MKQIITYSQLNEQFDKLVGKPLWAIVAGEGTGSILNLYLGEKLKRTNPLRNPHLSEDVRKNDSEFGIMIYCSWRVENCSEVICGSGESDEDVGFMLEGLEILQNKTVQSVHLDKILDLCICFEDNLKLKLFRDVGSKDKDVEDDLYFIIITKKEVAYSVSENGKIYEDIIK